MGQPGGLQPGERPIPGRELVRWPLLAWLLPLLPLAALIAAQLQPQRLLPLQLQEGTAATSDAFRLEAGSWGAPLLDLQVTLPANSTALYAIDLLNADGQPELQLGKEAWREVSSWAEDGESGIDDNADAAMTLDLRPRQSGFYRLRVELQELLDAAGQPLQQPLQAELRVRNHTLNIPLLLWTSVITAALVRLALQAYDKQGRQRAHCRRDDRHLDLRLVVGGPGLVRLTLLARYEGGLPNAALEATPELELLVCDDQGRRILRRQLPIPARRHRRDSSHWWTLQTRLHLRFDEPQSRRLRVVLPQQLGSTRARFEWGQLTVLDGCRVLLSTPVIDGPRPTTLPG
ncbi:MAG: hypothetical protein VKK62_03660 [Synechococcaceae cyanobacterium]|nr:hypothetical protein [Synechococcaceae cyanobacterium]